MFPLRHQLAKAAAQYGTPLYLFDFDRLNRTAATLRSAFPESTCLLYSLKANPLDEVVTELSHQGYGADVASAAELKCAVRSGVPPSMIFVSGPHKSHSLHGLLREYPSVHVSADSISELNSLAKSGIKNPLLIRLRPGFSSAAVRGPLEYSRFGVDLDALERCSNLIRDLKLNLCGFHVYHGSQVLCVRSLRSQIQRTVDLVENAAHVLGMTSFTFNLGLGLGVPYSAQDAPIDPFQVSQIVSDHMSRLNARAVLELGRYLVAPAGWYLTSVVGHQSYGQQKAVVVDGGTHHRWDFCGLGLRRNATPPKVVTREIDSSRLMPTSVLGVLCWEGDILAERALLPELQEGDILAFENAGAYGLTAAPNGFLSLELPQTASIKSNRLCLLGGA